MTKLDELKELYRLSQLARRGDTSINTTTLEDNFMAFSSYSPRRVLTVELPSMYELQGDEHQHVAAALASLGATNVALPGRVDFSGCFENSPLADSLIFFSLQQAEADHCRGFRSYLDPLLLEVYTNGTKLIRDFALHEAVVGKVKAARGSLDLQEINLFPERFTNGKYGLSVVLDTPTKTVEKFMKLHGSLEKFKANPKQSILDPKFVEKTTNKAIKLRRLLGSLSRYERPEEKSFAVYVDSCVVRTDDNKSFHLYAENSRKNVMVYFGEDPFSETSQPRELIVLDGNQYHHTLRKLTELGFYEASSAILEQRISDLRHLYDDAARGKGRALNGSYSDFSSLIRELEKVETHFKSVINPQRRTKFALKQPAELLEFIVYPTTEDPIIHELLPRISWNKAIREYHNTDKFTADFLEGDTEKRQEMLRMATSNVVFSNQQNNDVNVWLYKNHKDFCVHQGVRFEVLN